MHLASILFLCRKREYKFATNTFRADDIDIFTMSFDNFFHNRESESGSFFVFAARKIGLIDAFPDLVEFFSGDSNAGVFDRDKNLIIFLSYLYDDRRFIFTKFNRIVSQIV